MSASASQPVRRRAIANSFVVELPPIALSPMLRQRNAISGHPAHRCSIAKSPYHHPPRHPKTRDVTGRKWFAM